MNQTKITAVFDSFLVIVVLSERSDSPVIKGSQFNLRGHDVHKETLFARR